MDNEILVEGYRQGRTIGFACTSLERHHEKELQLRLRQGVLTVTIQGAGDGSEVQVSMRVLAPHFETLLEAHNAKT